MPRKGKNIEKSELFFSFQFNDKTDKTCRGSKKDTRTGACLQFLHFLLPHIVMHILSCMLSCIMCFITVYIAALPRFSPISADRFRFCTFALRGVQKTSARASVRQRIFHHVREMTQGQFAVVTQRHQILRFFPIEKQIRKAQ